MSHHAPPSADALAAALASHADRVAQLRRPGALPGPAAPPAPITEVQTHLSTLLFCGDRVYKLKKPVLTGFVDFTRVEARHEACLQELRLNRRTAPRHYLAVLPLVPGRNGVRLLPPERMPTGPVLDWAVQMRRFDDGARFDRLAEAGRLGAEHIDRLAEAVVRFHAQQPPAPPGYGRAECTRHWARENLAELAALVAADPALGATMGATVAALTRWTEQRGAALAPAMALRQQIGRASCRERVL
jgi:aminoglycoside phosphotransferase family enzyme